MSVFETRFKIIVDNQCPFYELGDEFSLSGNALLLEFAKEKTFVTTAITKGPKEKKTCRILVGDLTRILIEYESVDRIPSNDYQCSGCTGSVKLKHLREAETLTTALPLEQKRNIGIIADMLSNFSIFQSLDKHHLKDVVSYLKLKKYAKGSIILKKGSPAQNLYIILSGTVDVLDDKGLCLSTLKKGDVFGEMSLISGDPVGATIKVVENATIIFIRGIDFKNILNKFPSIQMYLARLLARRLAKSNIVMAEEIASGMVGRLSEISPTELLQTLSQNQKTGILTFSLPKKTAEFHYRNGDLIKAVYGKIEGKEAFFGLLKEKEGRFKFNPKSPAEMVNHPPIGAFMELLLEGLKRLDEERLQKEEPGQMMV